MSMSIATASPQKSADPPVQVWAIAVSKGIAKSCEIFIVYNLSKSTESD